MHFKARYLFLLAFLLCTAFLCMVINLRRCDQHQCPVCSNSPNGTPVTASHLPTIRDAIVHSHFRPLSDRGWVLDCITWDRKRTSTVNETLEDFTISTGLSELGEPPAQRKATFQKIFESRDWPADDPSYNGLKVSGPGAMLRRAQGAIAVLHSVVTKLRIHLESDSVSLLDVPCGDLQWIPSFLSSRPDVVYTGADIVPDLIQHHRRKFSYLTNATFIELDIVETIPSKAYDLVLVRDLLQHLWITDAMRALKAISDSGSRYLLATTFTGTMHNNDIDKHALGGRMSEYNLELPPFSLEPLVCISYDWNFEKLGLWALPLQQKHK